MAPSLGMSYDSENPLDISGVGWSLNGLSTITRCKRTLVTDSLVHPVDLTAADAYCLNGERLILISGTEGTNAEYRTEVESFQRVKSFGSNAAVGPDHWTVETRDGRILTIGGVGNATVLATKTDITTGVGTAVNWVWMVQRVQDQHGNYMTYLYEQSTTGEYFPQQILYTGNTAAGVVPYNSVDFIYEARNDVFSGRVSDAIIKRPNRLKQIRTRIGVDALGNGGSVVRQWNFAYTYSPYSNRSLMQSVTDCNGDASQCLPSNTFAWTLRDTSKNTMVAPGSGIWHGPGIELQGAYGDGTYLAPAQFAARAVVGDFNGDGKQDLLTNLSGSSTWSLCPSTGTDFACTSLTGMPNTSSENFFVGDFNGDGLSDVLVNMGSGQQWYLCLSTGTGFTCNQSTGLPTGSVYRNSPLIPLVADFSGDGRDDIMFKGTLCTSTGNAFTCSPYNNAVFGMFDTARGDPEEWTLPATQSLGDYDGDGRIDILASQSYAVNDGYCTTSPVNNCPLNATDYYRYVVGPTGLILTSTGGGAGVGGGGGEDINGDGVADSINRATINKHKTATTWWPTIHEITTCVGGTECTELQFQPGDWTDMFVGVTDQLQTGAPVGIYSVGSAIYTAPLNVDGSLVPAENKTMPWVSIPASTPTGKGMDVTGDGVGATAGYTPTGYTGTTVPTGNTGTWTVSLMGAGSFPDRLQSVTDGNGLTTRWTYTSGNDSTVVSAGPRLAYPTKNVHITTPVVSKMSVDADSAQTAGKTLDTTYTYSGMRMDLRGRGSLGFDTVKSTDVATGIVTTTQYSQAFPTIARTTAVTKVGGGVTLHSEVSTWVSLSTQSGLNVLYPYVRTRVTTGQDLDGTWLPRTTTQVGTLLGGSDGIDAYGNIANATTTSVENNGAGDTFQVTHQCTLFDNRVGSQWVLGLCKAASQAASLSNPFSVGTRQVSSTFDAFGALQSSTSMPGTALALTTTYALDPNVGVPTSITKAWTDPIDGTVKSPSTTISYDSAWRFPVTVTNALNQVEKHAYDAATGAQTSLIDFNNLTTSWKVDAWGRQTEEDRSDGTYSTFAHRKCVDTCGSLATHVDIAQHWAPGSVQMLAPEETLYDSRGRKLLYRTWNDANTEADTTWSYGDMGDLNTQTLPKYATDAATGTITTSDLHIDILHRPKQVDRTNAAGTGVDTTKYAYSALTTTTTDANLHTRTELLNALGKVKKVTDNNAQAVTYAYDGFGNLLSTTDPAGNAVRMGYDVMGHKTSMTDPDLGAWTYVVDAAGHTRQQKDAKSQVTTYWYDLLDRLTERLEPDLDSHWTFDAAANGVGMLAESYTWIAATSTKDYRHVYAYDNLSRPSSSTTTLDWDYTQLNTYDGYGHLATVTHRRSAVGAANVATNPTGAGGATKFVPIAIDDDLTIVIPAKVNVGTGQFGLPEIQYTLGYNVHGALSSVMRGATTLWTLNAEDAAGRTRLATFGSGLMTATGYNAFTALLETIQTGLSNGAGGVSASIQSDRYDYDPVGNLLHRYWLPASGAAAMLETFTYDALDRLWTSQVSGLDLKNFNYDALGNITSKANVGSYTYPPANGAYPHLVSRITGTVAGLTNPSFTYDLNGNTQSGLNRWYTWSAANLPLSVDQLSDGTQASATLRHEFLYGPDRERTREIVRAMSGTTIGPVQRTIYSADSIEKEVDAVAGTTKIRTYLPLGLGFTEEDFTGTAIAPTSIGTPVERYFHKDNLGSPVIVTDASQAVLERMAYDAWGRRRQSNGLEVGWQYLNAQSASNTLDHKGYTGQEQLDDLSLVHLNGRVYDPMTGRFTSPDPTIPDPFDLQSLNRASYVRNSPMDKVDPTGFGECPAEGCESTTHTGTMLPTKTVKGTNGSIPYTPGNAALVRIVAAAAAAANAPQGTRPNGGNDVPTKTPSRDAKDAGGGDRFTHMVASLPSVPEPVNQFVQGFGVSNSYGLTGLQHATAEDTWAYHIGEGLGLIPGAFTGSDEANGLRLLGKLNPCKCFVAGTMVQTKDGPVAIEKLKVGDLVVARDETTGETAFKPVLRLVRNGEKKVVRLTFVNAAGKAESLGVTLEHPFMADGKHWIAAGQLKPGDRLMALDGGLLTVKSVARYRVRHHTYNFEVGDFHTYFVGFEGAWVHNAGLCDLLPAVEKAVNSNLPHAVDRAVERGIFATREAAGDAIRSLSASIGKNGFPKGSILDTAHADRVLVPIGEAGMAVYQVAKNATAKLKTVLNALP